MKIDKCEQQSAEWWALKCGRIGGSRFGQVISTRENKLIYELMQERLSGHCIWDDYISDDMQYGIDNEDVAIQKYTDQKGIKVNKVGAILSDVCSIHIASPDGISDSGRIIQEVKCTMHGETHLQRVFEGVDSKHLAQIANYFAVSDEVEEVHYISYCGFRPERPIHVIKMKRDEFTKQIETGRKKVIEIESQLNKMLEQYQF